jgi:hypothetical protein
MTSPDTFPYRFRAETGMYEGTTFIYLADGSVISYRTDSPGWYFQVAPSLSPGQLRHSVRCAMTPEVLAGFEAVPPPLDQAGPGYHGEGELADFDPDTGRSSWDDWSK